MKKILCLILAVLLLTSVGIASVSADTLREKVESAFSEYCAQYEERYREVLIGDIIASSDEAIFFVGYPEKSAFEPWEIKIYVGDWIITNANAQANPVSAVYVMIEEQIYTIEGAYEQKLVTDLSPLYELKNYTRGSVGEGELMNGPDIYLIGDADFDGELTVKDATAIQKHLSDIEKIDCIYCDWVFDMDSNYRMNIKDATAIQKHIAGIAE